MKLDDFIAKLFNRYKCTAPDIDDKKEEITGVLIKSCEKIDFQKLLDVIARENETDFLPSGAKLKEWTAKCYKSEYKKAAGRIRHIAVRNTKTGQILRNFATEVPMTEEQILKCIKAQTHCNDWAIEEVYVL